MNMVYRGMISDRDLARTLFELALRSDSGAYAAIKAWGMDLGNEGIERRILNFWRTFKIELKSNLKAADDYLARQKELELESLARLNQVYLDVAKSVVTGTVTQDIMSTLGYGNLRTASTPTINVTVDDGYDMVSFDVKVTGYVGNTGRRNETGNDLRRLAQIKPTTISLDHIEGLTIDRYGRPVITSLEQMDGTGELTGTQRKATHVFEMGYGALIPKDMLPEVHSKHGPSSVH